MKKIFALILMTVFIFSCNNQNSRKQLTVLTNFIPAQQRYLRNEVLEKFENLYKCKINLVNYENNDELKRLLLEDANPQIALVSIPLEMTQNLVLANKITPMTDIVAPHVLLFDVASYYYKFSDVGRIKGIYYYLPHRIEMPVLFYMKSKAFAAIEKFGVYKTEINDSLKAINGFGLPYGYALEENPNDWDLYDIFVIGYIWGKEKKGDNNGGFILTHEMKSYSILNMLYYNAFALGAKPEEFVNMSGEAVEEVFLWEMVFGKYKIFNALSYKTDISSADIYYAFKNEEIFMAYFSQNDCFNILEGTSESNMIPYIFDVSDVGIALVPLIVPFSLDSGGNLSSKGKRVNVLQGYYWGIPKSAKEKELAYLLVQYLNNRVVNTKEVVRSGSIPVREDVLMNMKNIYDERWLGEGYTAALNQIIDYFDDKDWLWDIKNDKFFVYDNYVYMRNVINSGAPYKTSEINKNTVRSLISRNFPLKDEK